MRSLALVVAFVAGACVFPYTITVSGEGGIDGSSDATRVDGDAVADAVVCHSGETACGAACATLSTSLENCGRCGNACSSAGGTASCVEGTCVTRCDATHADCDGEASNGCEVDLRSNASHCGTCDRACTSGSHQSAVCTNGGCVRTCDVGFGDCDGDFANGCETDLSSSLGNCGACDALCLVANGTGRCQGGVCSIGACTTGFADCDLMASNGCEVNLATNPAHCGLCSHACTAAAATTCGNMMCVSACLSTGTTFCSGGCVDLMTDARNCGSCGRVCPSSPTASPRCSGGTCGFAPCPIDRAHCSGPSSNGCEVNTATDANNCGGCGMVCPSEPNAIATCTAGTCSIDCRDGFGDCDHTQSTGCEVSLDSDPMNCGACTHRCGPGQSCLRGACVCPLGSTMCEGACANLSTDMANCGTCGHACGATQSCVSGRCSSRCDPPRRTCGPNCTDVSSDAANCGDCGTACTGGKLCVAGGCACPSGTMDCGGVCTDPSSDPNNCGACGMACPAAGALCVSGACTCPSGTAACVGRFGMACTDTQTDARNCGSCGHACGVGTSCTAGTCS